MAWESSGALAAPAGLGDGGDGEDRAVPVPSLPLPPIGLHLPGRARMLAAETEGGFGAPRLLLPRPPAAPCSACTQAGSSPPAKGWARSPAPFLGVPEGASRAAQAVPQAW